MNLHWSLRWGYGEDFLSNCCFKKPCVDYTPPLPVLIESVPYSSRIATVLMPYCSRIATILTPYSDRIATVQISQ